MDNSLLAIRDINHKYIVVERNNKVRKILLLGGSAQQVGVIKTAKKMGCYTILCDYLPDNPGQYVADKFYLISTTEKEKVLEIARREKINAILAYASDPAAPTAAYIAGKMKLPGNPYTSVEILCNKDRFRKFLRENGFNSPQTRSYTEMKCILEDCENEKIKFPSIIKPVDSSGSKGITVLKGKRDIKEAAELAFSFSKSHKIIIEEYIEKKHQYLIGGDIFVVDGKVVLWGLLNCYRDAKVNPLVPVGKSYPLQLSAEDRKKIEDTLQLLVDRLKIKAGAMNIEAVIDKEERVWLIDVGPRSGGNMIPDLLGEIYQIDIAKMSVKVALGDKVKVVLNNPQCCYATYNVHCNREGYYSGLEISENIQKYIVKKYLYKKEDDIVERFDNASKCVGIIFMCFENERVMKRVLEKINDSIYVQLK